MSRPFVEEVSLHIDDRGSVYCPADNLDKRMPDCRQIKRTYVVQNWKEGIVRAWHGHKESWTGLHTIHGVAKIISMSMDNYEDKVVVTMSPNRPSILWVPPGWYNGFVSLVDNTKLLVYSTATFEEVKKDDYRRMPTGMELELFKVAIR